MHSAVRLALANAREKLALSIVGAKKGVTVLLAFSSRSPFPEWVAKVGSGPGLLGALERVALERERVALELVAASALDSPKVLSWSVEGGSPCLVFTGASGFSEHFGLHAETGSARDERCLNQSLACLKRLRESVPAAGIEQKLGKVDDLAWLESESRGDPALGRLHGLLRSSGEQPRVATHGDFWCGNLLFHEQNLAVIDWEGLSARHPLHDVLSLLTHCTYRAGSRVELNVSPGRFVDLFFSGSNAAGFVRKTARELEPDPSRLKSAFYAFVAHSLRIKGGRYRESWLEILRTLDERGFPAPWPG